MTTEVEGPSGVTEDQANDLFYQFLSMFDLMLIMCQYDGSRAVRETIKEIYKRRGWTNFDEEVK